MSEPSLIEALYFDGRSARGQPVLLRVQGRVLRAEALPAAAVAAAVALHGPQGPLNGPLNEPLNWPLSQVVWPERTRHGQRVVQLHDGGSLQVADTAAFDAWRQAQGAAESWVVRAQQNWPATLAAVLALVLVVVVGYRWGVPVAARGVVHLIPHEVDRSVGDMALSQVQSRWLSPSRLPAARQAELRALFAGVVQAAHAAQPAGPVPAFELLFRSGAPAIGPNAFALPGGTIVVTDALVALLQGHDDTLLGVLAHELGHVQHRHGLQGLVQFALLNAATSVALGDFSSLIATLPALLAQMSYSRDAERQSDAFAAQLLLAAGKSPAVMVVLFERLQQARADGGPAPPLAWASHPLDSERMRFFSEAALRR